jgi:hypothetical protein
MAGHISRKKKANLFGILLEKRENNCSGCRNIIQPYNAAP